MQVHAKLCEVDCCLNDRERTVYVLGFLISDILLFSRALIINLIHIAIFQMLKDASQRLNHANQNKQILI